LALLDDSGGELFVPVDKVQTIKLLIGEIAEVMGETKSAAEKQINEALKTRKSESS
jgi:hypothetical protein